MNFNIWFATEEHAALSNLALRPFKDKNGWDYVSVEHAYQTWKSGTFDKQTYLRNWKNGSKFKGTRKAKTANNWNIDLMHRLMLISFKQNPEASFILLETEDSTFTHTQDRGIWRLEFPRLLELVRSELTP